MEYLKADLYISTLDSSHPTQSTEISLYFNLCLGVQFEADEGTPGKYEHGTSS